MTKAEDNNEHDTSPTALGAYVRAERERAGLSIRQLAGLVGVHASSIMRLESGQHTSPSPDLLQRLADVLELDPGELLAFIGVKPSLPEPRIYLRKKYGMSEAEAQEIV